MKDQGKFHISNAETFQKAFGVSRETVARLETYAALLKRWQKTINLVAPSTLDFSDMRWRVQPPLPHHAKHGSAMTWRGLE
jgi:hypothetical protein